MPILQKGVPFLLTGILACAQAISQPILETGGGPMPDQWIDKDTRHKVIKLTRKQAANVSFSEGTRHGTIFKVSKQEFAKMNQ
ncbi:MAG TPA: hypothetical protein VK907_10155 [Phnomibacter sp.]|nr:hypothetical protein [Phnomibacter sp.]